MESNRKTVSPIDLAYFAGLFDGEGCVSLAPVKRRQTRVSYQLSIAISLTHLPTLQHVRAIWSLGTVNPVAEKRLRREHNKPMWRWSALSNQACYILEIVTPLLIVKKAEAELGIAFQHEKRRRKKLFGYHGSTPEIYYAREKQVRDILKQNRQTDRPNMGHDVEILLREGQLPFLT